MSEDDQSQNEANIGLGVATIAKSPEFSRWTLDLHEVIGIVDAALQGASIRVDRNGQVGLVRGEGKQLLNEEGRRLAILPLLALTHKGTTLSNANNKEIATHVKNVHVKVAENLLRNWRRYGITDPLEIPYIANLISLNVFFAIKRAHEGDTWKQLGKFTQVNEIVKSDRGGSSGGVLGFMNRGGGEGG